MTDYRDAPEPRQVANTHVIPQHHAWLKDFAIEYLYRPDWAKKGRTVWAQIKKASPLEKYLSGYDLIIVFNEEIWPRLDDMQKRALVDHELTHVVMDVNEKTGEVTFGLVGHDLEEFTAIVQRYGDWTSSIKEFAEARGQHALDFGRKVVEGLDRSLHKDGAKAAEEAKLRTGGGMQLN